MSKGILTEYILNKLFAHDVVATNLEKDEMRRIRSACLENIPRKISNSEQIKPFIEKIFDEILEEKANLFCIFKDMAVNKICEFVDYIIQRRMYLNEKRKELKSIKKRKACKPQRHPKKT